ncbi:MAG: hypothetical protein ACF8R9_12405 [Phycisphaerales bacterium JB054]
MGSLSSIGKVFDGFKSVGVAADAATLATLGIGAVGGAVASPVLACGGIAIAGLAGWSVVRDWKTGEKIDKVDAIEQWLADAARKKGQADATLEQILVYAIDPDGDARDAIPEGLSVDPIVKMLAIIQAEGKDREKLIAGQSKLVEALRVSMATHFDSLKNALKLTLTDLASVRNDLRRANSTIDMLEWLWLDRERPPLHIPQLADTEANRFNFAARRVTMRGREAELAELAAFLDHDAKFRWAAWTGLAGVGKSRLALELCRIHGDLGWEVGFFNWHPARPVAWDKWHPDLPTLIVFDYVQEHAAEIRDAISELARGAGGLGRKVRVLLLERPAPEMVGGSWWETLLDKAHSVSAARIRESCHDRDNDEPRPRPLGGLEAEPVREILREFASRDNASTGAAAPVEEDEIGRQLAQIETIDPARRPLIVALAAEAIEAGALQPQWNATDLVRYVLDREAAKRKLALHAAGVDDAEQPRWTTLYVLSTMCGGLEIPDEGSVFDDKALQRWIPPLDRYDNGSIMAQFAVGATARHLPKLEPDMLGELFVLGEMAEDSHRNTALLAAAWRHDADGFLEFLFRAVDTFPQHPALDRLLGMSEGDDARPSPRARTLAFLWGRRADRLRAFGDTPREMIATDRILDLLRPVVAHAPGDVWARRGYAIGLFNACIDSGADPARADELLGELRTLAGKLPDDAALRQQLAKGLFNALHDSGADTARSEGLLGELRTLAGKHFEDAAVREQFAKGMTNAIAHSGAAPARADSLLGELRTLSGAHPDDAAVREQLAMGLNNAIVNSDADPARADRLLGELRTLAGKHAEHAAVREPLATASLVSIVHATGASDPLRATEFAEAMVPLRDAVLSQTALLGAFRGVFADAIELAGSEGDTESERRLRAASDAIFGE